MQTRARVPIHTRHQSVPGGDLPTVRRDMQHYLLWKRHCCRWPVLGALGLYCKDKEGLWETGT